jgi:ubiquinone/menaquinone biosynthesis C-methylase UbiE
MHHRWRAPRRLPLGRLACLAALLAVLAPAGVLQGSEPPSQERQPHGRLFPPEDLGLLEGPDREAWQQPSRVMDVLGIADGSVVADIGAGGGWFTVRLARRVGPHGVVYAEDVQRQMIDAIARRMQREGLRNVHTVLGTDDDAMLPPNTLDAAIIVDAYHEVQNRVALLQSIERALKPTGRLGIIDFKMDGGGPGPPMEERVQPEQIVADAQAAGLRLVSLEDFLPYQYLLIFGK